MLTTGEMFHLRQALHVAVLDALLASRRWQPGELVFQGGTSLHLAHGSPRFSEDLDFLVHSTLNLEAIAASVQHRLAGAAWLPRGTTLAVSKAKDGHNPHAFVVAVGGQNVIGAVRVKVELWKTTRQSMEPLSVNVVPVRLAAGPAAGAQAFVPTADLQEIYVDKVFALGARPYLKPRDIFDLHWIQTSPAAGRHARPPVELRCDTEALALRLATYPNETPQAWLEKAARRAAELPGMSAAVSADLRRWLPSSWPMDDGQAAEMIDASVSALHQGMEQMRQIAASRELTTEPADSGTAAGEAEAGEEHAPSSRRAERAR